MAEPDEPTDAAPRRKYPEYQRKTPPLTIHELIRTEDSLGRVFFHKPDGTAVCGRKKKKRNRVIPDEACCSPPTSEGPCRVHGAGGGRPWTSGGRYSRSMKRWNKALERALADQALLDTKPDIAVMDVLIEKLLRRVEGGDCPEWRAELEEIFDKLEEAIRRNRQKEVAKLMTRLGAHIRSGASVDQLAEDLTRLVERRANQANKASSLSIMRETHVSVKELTLVLARWIEVLQDHLDPTALRAIVPQLERATVGTSAGALQAPKPGANGGGCGDDEANEDDDEDGA
jgi:hypothetical protein